MKKGSTARETKEKGIKTPDPALLLAWYDRHGRDLPWRVRGGKRPDPYAVWLSEIMLQQTTVVTVKPYFEKFLHAWPTVQDLAGAALDDVLRAWAGLGYYRRARGLFATAQEIVQNHKGLFPADEVALRTLPGLGPYTAAAVAAIAFDQPASVVDGNVERVMARLFAVDESLPRAKKTLRALAQKLLPTARYGDYAQALMDLGATVCTPRKPKCALCPWSKTCAVAFLPEAETFPRREKPQAKPLRRGIAFVVWDPKGRVLLRKRGPTGLFAGMMEVPSTDWAEGALPDVKTALAAAPVKAEWQALPGLVRHSFTHFDLEMGILSAKLSSASRLLDGKWVASDAWPDEALPSLMRKILGFALSAGPVEKKARPKTKEP